MALWTFDSSAVTFDSTSATFDGSQGGGGGAALAGASTDAVTAAGGLINFASVTLVAPLYTGVGGIFDPNLVWPFSTPVVGSVVKYDPAAITVLPDGQINATANNVAAEIQYFDGVNLNEIDVFITPTMVGYAFDGTIASGTFVGAAALAAAAANLSSAAGVLTTGIPLQAAASNLTSAVGALNTAIQLASAASDSSSASALLGAVGANLAGAATDTSSGNASLTTLIAVAGAAADVASAAAALSTAIQLAAQATDSTTASGPIRTNILFIGAATDSISGAGLLGSIQVLQAAANDVTTAFGSLITQIALAAAASSTSIAAGSLTSQIKLSGSATDSVTASGALGVLALNLRPSHLIVTSFYSNQLLGQAGPLPYGEFFSRVDDVEIYAIDWTGWLTNFWERGAMVAPGSVIRPTAPNGFQFVTTLGGQSGNAEPVWPNAIGQMATDGSVVWTCEAIDLNSLFANVQSAEWVVQSGITVKGQEQSGNLTLAELDATGATAGQNYAVNVETTMSDGETKVGQIVLKVR
jgi:hypothetical protein